MIKKISILIFILVSIISWMLLKDSFVISSDPKDITLINAKELYTNNCSSCHMINLAGNSEWKLLLDEDGQRLPPPLNGTGHTWHHSPQQLFDIIRYGYKKMDPNYMSKKQNLLNL